MQQSIQLHTELSSDVRLAAVQQYVNKLAGDVSLTATSAGAVSAYDAEILDLDKKESHLLESDIAATRIYPRKPAQTTVELKTLFSAETLYPIYEEVLKRGTDAVMWTATNTYKAILILDSIAERLLTEIAAVWGKIIDRLSEGMQRVSVASDPVPVTVQQPVQSAVEYVAPLIVEVLERPQYNASLDTLVFSVGSEETIREVENDMPAEAAAYEYPANSEDVAAHETPVMVHDVDNSEAADRVTVGGVAKALYMNLRYGPPHLR